MPNTHNSPSSVGSDETSDTESLENPHLTPTLTPTDSTSPTSSEGETSFRSSSPTISRSILTKRPSEGNPDASYISPKKPKDLKAGDKGPVTMVSFDEQAENNGGRYPTQFAPLRHNKYSTMASSLDSSSASNHTLSTGLRARRAALVAASLPSSVPSTLSPIPSDFQESVFGTNADSHSQPSLPSFSQNPAAPTFSQNPAALFAPIPQRASVAEPGNESPAYADNQENEEPGSSASHTG